MIKMIQSLPIHDSIEKAILHSALKEENEELSVPDDFLNHVDETFHIWNGEQYDTIFYRAGTNDDPVQGFVFARLKSKYKMEIHAMRLSLPHKLLRSRTVDIAQIFISFFILF